MWLERPRPDDGPHILSQSNPEGAIDRLNLNQAQLLNHRSGACVAQW